MKSIKERISAIKNTWFITEPAYFIVICMLEIKETDSITDNICCGSNCIYINPSFFENKTDKALEEFLKVECTRMLLKHPSGRQLPNKELAYAASNAVLSMIMKTKYVDFVVNYTVFYGESYEDVYLRMKGKNPPVQMLSQCNGSDDDSQDGSSNNSNNKSCGKSSRKSKSSKSNSGNVSEVSNADMNSNSLLNSKDAAKKNSSKWGEDGLSQSVVDDIRTKIGGLGKNIGSLPSEVNNDIFARNIKEPDYKSILRKFRASVINSNNTLTRMKPNRRYGYTEMGSKRVYSTKLLICGDMSGSMSAKEVGEYIAFIGGFFKYGISSIDFIQFDVKVYDDSLQKFSKRPNMITRKLDGGTDVSDIVDYVENRSKTHYDGIIVCSDGYFYAKKDLWDKAANRNNYLFCINTKQGYNDLKPKFNNKVKLTYIEYNVGD